MDRRAKFKNFESVGMTMASGRRYACRQMAIP
jgi:hypothetical protein